VLSPRISKFIALAALIIVLLLVNWKIVAKERHLSDGDLVYLELAPVDPRSLVQGDYMALRFQLSRDITKAVRALGIEKTSSRQLKPADGFVEVALDERQIGKFASLKHDVDSVPGSVDSQSGLWLHYRIRNNQIKIATNAFFFQEGHAERYESARYGKFRVDAHGDLLLTAMCTEDLECLGASF